MDDILPSISSSHEGNFIFDGDDDDDDNCGEVMTAAQVLAKLKEAWLNEKFSPELLPHQAEIVECIIDQLHEMQRNIDRVKKADFKVGIHKMEIDRIRFILTSYLRLRLEKIEQFAEHILEHEKQTGKQLMTDEERTFATTFRNGIVEHFKSVALQNLPLNVQTLDLKKTAVAPHLDSYVFLKVTKDVAGVVVEDETDDAREEVIDLQAGDQHIMRYKPISSLVQSGDVVLI